MCILLFSGVTLFEYNVSTILLAIVGYYILVTELFSILRIKIMFPASCLHRQIPCSLYLAFLSGRDGHASLALVFSSTTDRSLPFKAHACTGEISGGRFQANSFSRGKISLKRQLFSR